MYDILEGSGGMFLQYFRDHFWCNLKGSLGGIIPRLPPSLYELNLVLEPSSQCMLAPPVTFCVKGVCDMSGMQVWNVATASNSLVLSAINHRARGGYC